MLISLFFIFIIFLSLFAIVIRVLVIKSERHTLCFLSLRYNRNIDLGLASRLSELMLFDCKYVELYKQILKSNFKIENLIFV
jgi:hypothetical protein